MRNQARRFLLLLMMLALPVQTFASAAMLGCVLSHQAAMAPMAMADDGMSGCHEPEESAPASQDCTHCTACALASALPIPATDAPMVMPVGQSFTSQAAAFFSGFVPEGPERPPRPTFA